MLTVIAIIIFAILFLANAIRILNEYERGVIFRLGRVIRAKGPGIILLIPVIDRMQKVSLRVIVQEVPTQDVITRDNVSVKVSAVIYFRVSIRSRRSFRLKIIFMPRANSLRRRCARFAATANSTLCSRKKTK